MSACKWLARAMLAVAFAGVVVYQLCLVFDLNHKNYGEGPILAFMERMQSEPLSLAWANQPPYGLSCYGPAFYWLANAAAQLSGLQHSLIPGRAISFMSAVIAACLAGIAASRRTQSLENGLLAAVMFLTSLPVMEWSPFARVDMLAIMFIAAAYLVAGVGGRRVTLAAICIVAGSLAKPTASLAAIPIFLHLLAHARYREASRFAALVSLLGAATWGFVQWATNGFFLTSVLVGNRNPMILWRGYSHTYAFISSPLAAAAGIVVALQFIAAPQRFVRSLYSLAFVVSLAISAVISCKQGSEINYFLEPALLASLAVAIEGLPRLSELNARRAALAMAFLGAVVAVPNLRELKVRYFSPPKRPATFAAVKRILADEPADVEVLADGRTIPMVLEAGRRPWLNDPYLYTLLVDNGALDPAPLLDRMKDGRIKWLILRRPVDFHVKYPGCWPPEALAMIPRHYTLASKAAGLSIYRHR
ncbi:MAG TPA: hypothetical protein VHC19_13955 [Pirellulales bacterium]|nr:hypothetical protein [Pirellulales bacterium]